MVTTVSMYRQQEVLHSPFDINTHKETFTNYLEVVIHPNGTIHYAVPSHQEYLYAYLMKKWNKSREWINAIVPKAYYFDMHIWLCKESKCIMVWDHEYVGEANRFQRYALKRLKKEGLYKGDI